MLVVVDASGADPVGDYKTVREELRMYNPDYVRRPHILALNKMDLEVGGAAHRGAARRRLEPWTRRTWACRRRRCAVSAVEGIGMDALLSELGDIMREEDDARVQTIREGPARRETTGEGTNMKIRF